MTLATHLDVEPKIGRVVLFMSRNVPNEILQVPGVPRTLSGKKMEVPIKKLLLGHAPEKIANRDAMANPECLTWYFAYAQDYLTRAAQPA